MALLGTFLVALLAAVVLTPLVRASALRYGVVDRPDGKDAGRKVHRVPTALLGGFAIAIAAAIAVGVAVAAGALPGAHIKAKHLIGLGIAALFLVLGGALDDRYDFRPSRQIIWPMLAAAAVIASGIGVDVITNPFGGLIHLDRVVVPVFTFGGIPYKLTLLADLFTFGWLMGTTYTTKLLDGLDGLVVGTAAIGALVVAAVSLTRDVSQPDTAALAMALAGACLGFLVYNFHPASIFLGEGGSTFAGFMLGALAIVAGGKIATTLLILGLPIFDAAFVIVRRIASGKSPVAADRSHLHHRLLDLGLTQRQAVLVYWLVAAMFGSATLILQGWEKLIAMSAILIILVFVAAAGVSRRRTSV
jgi:UDP-GlcNAc:undecaprenyl-phosphate GlcNAc-1-phosphate transferase